MGFLEDFYRRKGSNAAAHKRAEAKKKRTTVKFNTRYDKRRYEQTLAAMSKFDRERARLCDTVPTGNGMTSDAFFLFLLTEPADEAREDIKEDYWLNTFVRDKLRNLKEFEELRALGTVGDELNSALAYCTIRPTLEELWDETKVEQELVAEMQQAMQQLAQKLREAQQVEQDLADLEKQAADLRPVYGPPEPATDDDGEPVPGDQPGEGAAGEDDEEHGCTGEGGPVDGGGESQPGNGSGPGTPSNNSGGSGTGNGAGSPLDRQIADKKAELEALSTMCDNLDDAVEAARKAADESLSEKEADLERSLQKAVREAADDAAEMQSAMSSLGWDASPTEGSTKVDFKERMELAERLARNKDILDLAKMIGRNFRVLETEIRKDAPDSRAEIRDVVLGDDIGRLLPQEYMALRHPRLKKEARCRLEDRNMLQLRLGGDERVGLGSIICEIDGSGSMAGLPHRWAVGIAGAFMQHAKQEDRGFLGVHFGSSHQIAEYPFDKSTGWQPTRVLDFFEHFFNGGTDFQAPLSVALDHLRKEHEATGVVKGDIVFITDGVCQVRDDWFDEFKSEQERLGFHVFGVRIGEAGFGYGDGTLDRICDDRVVTVTDFSSPDEIRSIFRSLHRA